MADLFSVLSDKDFGTPLSEKIRPKSFSDFIGQEKLFQSSRQWLQHLKSGHLSNIIFWGPPGTGKTSLARIIGEEVNADFISVNAVETGAKVLREMSEKGRHRRTIEKRRTIIFIDEIHRLNRSQQDVLLPAIESGDLILIGATTENPSYELNSALLSRSKVFIFERLNENDLKKLIEKIIFSYNLTIDQVFTSEVIEAIIHFSDGDARRLINCLETVFNFKEYWPLSHEHLENLNLNLYISHDKDKDSHYDLISAFIKSIRGSNPDAALYYLARMLKGGEDPKFIARRMVILASEDIGNADPKALPLAISGFHAVEIIGLPEAAINLAHVVTYLSSAPKSNKSYLALKAARLCVEETGSLPVPMALKSAKTKLMKELGAGKSYQYSHESERGYIEQNFLPSEIADKKFYHPSDHGFEKNIKQYLSWLRGN